MIKINKIHIKDEALKIIAKINEKNPYYLIIGVLVMLLLADYFFIMRFQLGTLRALGPKKSELADHFKQFETNRSRVEKYKKDIVLLDEKLVGLEGRLRTVEQIPAVLEELSRAANRNKIFVQQILPDTNLAKPVLKNDEGQYYRMSVVVEGKSGYHHFAKFLNELEETGSLMRVNQLGITSAADNPRQHQVKLEVQAVIFEPTGSRRVAVSEPATTRKRK